MPFNRGDIIMVYFDLPYSVGETKEHPAIIISNEEVYNQDEMYIVVMMTSTGRKDSFSFEIEDEMLLKKNNKEASQARCHLVTYITEKQITPNKREVNTLKEHIVDKLVTYISENSFSKLD
ncbi:type II toxin-antitoxin system PemK/MazF family toxin [Leeuwenhoekiella polynyae]|uniref:mRNA interferase MazF n=1 Tax=Leeuwenhoekiella polynyae TaxID=1550906 RepID=A0A4V1KRQ1_9FLAO|nr:type II toxin-antitoxin system PemK/MazF family toxin [Leeuwenhoekiella polynyae]RXG25692.1 mRNA interferase MazF [Leeuwenhoekiella polynyae]